MKDFLSMTVANSNGKLTFWILGALLALVLLFVGQSLGNSDESIRAVVTQSQMDSNRISVVETIQSNMQRDLIRIEDKLDYLILLSQGYEKNFKNFGNRGDLK